MVASRALASLTRQGRRELGTVEEMRVMLRLECLMVGRFFSVEESAKRIVGPFWESTA